MRGKGKKKRDSFRPLFLRAWVSTLCTATRQRPAVIVRPTRLVGTRYGFLPLINGLCLFTSWDREKPLDWFTLCAGVLNQIAMADNEDKLETRRAEQQDLEAQQRDLFDELSREQAEAEQALQDDQAGSAGANSSEKMG